METIDQPRTATSITVIPSGRSLGAEIRGVDLSQTLGSTLFKQIEDALHQHKVLVFRSQTIDDAQQIGFSKLFGAELDIHSMTQFAKPDHPEIFILSNIVENGRNIGAVDAAQYWHSDLCYTPTPSRVSVMYAIEIPIKDGKPLGPTDFANTVASWKALDPERRAKLEGKLAKFMVAKQKPSKKASHFNKLDDATKSRLQDFVVHPAVRTHPFTGEKALYVNHGFTTEILDMDSEVSQELLDYLFEFTTRPEFSYRHHWAPGDLVIWDNASTLHQGVGDYELPLRRLIHRTIVKGGKPF
jgi:taurine dioxygenase